MAKKFKFFSLAALLSFGLWAALTPTLPSPEKPIVFYSNQTRDDLSLVLKKVISSAHSSIYISMYAITDEMLTALLKKRSPTIDVEIYTDRKSGSLLGTPVKCKGLMHRKIVVIDDKMALIGSANMTTSSLLHHDNLTLGLYDPGLAHFLRAPTSTTYDFSHGKVWLLPDPAALDFLTHELARAKSSIFIAMFTLTHPVLLDALVKAHNRGVAVTVALDHYAARGASQKAVHFLNSHHVKVVYSQGLQLFHHKWALIDQDKLILGSTNWTRAAFTKNQDCLVFLQLPPPEQKYLKKLCRTILLESIDTL